MATLLLRVKRTIVKDEFGDEVLKKEEYLFED
jgi:hypothetical protein